MVAAVPAASNDQTTADLLLQQQLAAYDDNSGKHIEQLLVSNNKQQLSNRHYQHTTTSPSSLIMTLKSDDRNSCTDSSDARRSACLADNKFTTSMINNVNSIACLATPLRGPRVNQNSVNITIGKGNSSFCPPASGFHKQAGNFNLQLATSGEQEQAALGKFFFF